MKKGIIVLVMLIVVVSGAYFYQQQRFVKKASEKIQTQKSFPIEELTYEEDQKIGGNTGKVLAGSKSVYKEFHQTDYEKAKAEGKIIFLDFYANWCPICRAEAPVIEEGFSKLQTDQVVGFRVNFKDDETDDAEKALAQKYNIPYQHTKVIIKDGKEVLRSGDAWDAETFDTEIQKVLSQ